MVWRVLIAVALAAIAPASAVAADRAGGGAAAPRKGAAPPVNTANADRCDFLDPAVCLYPWPNDHFTRADASTPTGRRLNLNRESMPENRFGVNIDPSDQNRADGFSPGNMIVTRVPGLDSQAAFERTGAVPITDMARSFDANQPVVVVNARTLQRHLIWAEVDSNPAAPADRTLIIRPGTNFDEGERYIVALRNLRDAGGKKLKPRAEFRAYRDGLASRDPALESRRAHFEDIFAKLGQAGIERSSLYLAWDFTVASRESLTGRALAIRDDAFAALGDTNLADRQVPAASTTPTFVPNPDLPDGTNDELDGKRDFTAAESATTARRISGRLVVPCYLNAPGCPPGSSFQLDGDGKPVRAPGNTTEANVICTVPRRALDAPTPEQVRVSLYGHGLLGSADEVGAGNVQRMGQEHGYVFCATDWAGMSTTDVPNVVTLLQDLSNFKSLADRIQQGYVNFMYLGRWLLHPAGAASHPYFSGVALDRQALFYDGNSQGGILSGGLTALTPDFERAVHGVPGMNYSTLLRRSVDFDTYANGDVGGPVDTNAGLYDNYPNELERPLILSAIQLLWDRGESNGYAHHMTSDPLPNTPTHAVLLHTAFGDHQVADVTTEVEARTIGAFVHRPLLVGHRPRYRDRPAAESAFAAFGLPSLPLAGGHDGSALVFWDVGPLREEGGDSKGTPPPPPGNVPPREGNDPHSAPRNDPEARRQKALFLRVGGFVENVCGAGPCYAGGYTGAP